MAGPIKAPMQVGEWVIDPQTDTIRRRGETQKLEPRTMRLLLLLAQNPGVVVSAERMLGEVWQGVIVSTASVYQAVSQLRRLLGDTDPDPTYIATVPRKGYQLVAQVAALTPPDPPPAPILPMPPTALPQAPPPPMPSALRSFVSRYRIGFPLTMILTLAAFAVGGWLIWDRFFVAPPLTSQSIVVLPFVDMTQQGQDQSFCDGLTEELSNWLAQIPTLRVVARTSAFVFRGQTDARQIGRALNTTHVLEGSMRRSGDHMRVTVQLIDTRSGYHLWSSEYDRQVDDTIAVQEDIARAVAQSLQIRLTENTVQRFAERRTANSQAYNLFLLAGHYRQQRTRDSTMRAIELYQQALAADPNYALAYVGLAYTYLNQRWVDTRTVHDITIAAEPLLEVAQRLDPNLSELYAVRGALRVEQLRLDEAQRDLQRAIALSPNNSWAFAELGRLYLQQGRPRDAFQMYSQALTLDPLDFLHHARQCVVLSDMARYTEAGAECARARALQDEGNFGTVTTSWLEWTQGNLVKALEWNAEALRSTPKDINLYELRADFLLALGLSQPARRVLEQALAATADEEDTNLSMASVVFYEGGPAALRSHLASTRLDDSTRARHLIRVAYFHALAGDASLARQSIALALSATDFNEAALNDPWYARWGESDLLVIALCESQSGEQDSSARHLRQISAMLDQEIAAGTERFGIYELQAQVLALREDADGAMRALTRAADLGWRRSWWAQREPYFALLRARPDFRALIARVDESNRQLRTQVQLAN
jgi:TolB-like protein/DNA-binding winged helix-turn-helix (wHTH) protein/Tfp pilus assembly protein PilF